MSFLFFQEREHNFDVPTDAERMRTRRRELRSGTEFASSGCDASGALSGTNGRRRGTRSVSPVWAVGDEFTVAVGAGVDV